MRVLHVEAGKHLYGGAKQVLYLLSGLQQQGIDSLLVCPPGSAVAAAAREIGVAVEELSMGGDLDIGLIFRLWRTIKRYRPDLVHVHSRRGADLMGGVAAHLCGVKSVLSRRVDNPEQRMMVRWKYPLFDRVIAISQGIADVLREEGVAAERLVCVRSAVDVERYQLQCDKAWFREQFGLAEDALVMGAVAQLIPRKGHRYLLEAMPRLARAFPRLHLLIFGKGALREKLEQQIEALQLQPFVTLAGFRDDLPQLLPCLDLLVHPALMEGLGVSLLQAASAGLPIVAVDAGGMPEAVEDGVNGLLVPGGSVEALADALYRLLEDEALRRRMGESGREKMRRGFSVERMVLGNLAVYRDLLDDGEVTD
ncbi:MAG: glycosyltransferase [Candidatus Thiodiazotropha sp. (ex Ctena orbiculata)]|nr:glycosyltransferase [Candidatus Thiodiazotropha taylori]PUB84553.1 MAG: glycosyl transferase [gamma proteobacterium symbiont of Ctena orbiculata]MBT2995193.1 glycosyltransferase [Candidatus Thiodiazotropha taylori]MBT2999888.1 glycosyltransferase [Candidatus Thiodiazotropha taylori]MBT3027898.1 glycosyltransferase [Candidatus Thiodiazotropha taylori]